MSRFLLSLLVLATFGATIQAANLEVKGFQNSLFRNHIHQDDPMSCQGRCNQTGTIPDGCQCNIPCIQFGDCCEDYYTLCLGLDVNSCKGRCDVGYDPSLPCQCNTECVNHGNCCADHEEECGGVGEGSCKGRCDQVGTDPTAPCQCNKPCVDFGDCCPDYQEECGSSGGPITDAELEALAEELLALEENNAASYVTVDLEGTTLLTVDPAAYEIGTFPLLVALHDNYFADVGDAEEVTAEELAEEGAFVTAIFNTPLMQRAMEFLSSKGLASDRETFEEMWLALYSRSGGPLGSSGFEHSFLGEIKGGVSGFHNWAFYDREEKAGRLVYGGYMHFVDLQEKGSVLEFTFDWMNQNKPITSMFIGTTVELELALYSVCWQARPNSKCPISLNGQKMQIQTYTIGSSGQHVGSAYPDLSN